MIADIKKLKKWAEVRQENARKNAAKYEDEDTYREGLHSGRYDAFSWLLVKLDLLLNTERKKDGEKCDKK